MPKGKAEFVDFKIVKQTPIVKILEHYKLMDGLKHSGDSLCGCCPIHGGDNDSAFRVSISKNCFNCFSKCGGGNVVDFVRLKEGVPFREAALLIQRWFAVDSSPKNEVKKEPVQKQTEKPTISEKRGVNEPLKFSLKNLDQAHPYLKERDLNPETIAEFGLGFFSAEKGSMVGRIVIPIHNRTGELIGYAGRTPGEPPEGTSKYKLPPGLEKSLEVFNLHRAIKEDAQKPLVVVEGFFDCIRIWQAGYYRVVAVMGSSVSEVQARLLTEASSNLILLFDEDKAGREGAEKALPLLCGKAFVKTPVLPKERTQPDQLSDEELLALLK